jgi:hypothetical protein
MRIYPFINEEDYVCRLRVVRSQNGIQVFWTEEEQEFHDFFPYAELVNMKINVLDLLQNPKFYRINAKKHAIESSVKIAEVEEE